MYRLFFFLFVSSVAVGQTPDWKHTINLQSAQTFHLDRGDTIHILTTTLPQRILKISPGGQTLGFPPVQFNGIPFWGRTAIIDTASGYLLAAGTAEVQGFQRFAVAKIDLWSGAVLQLGYETEYWPNPSPYEESVALGRDQAGQIYLLGTAAPEPSQAVFYLIMKFDDQLQLLDKWFNPGPVGLGAGFIGSNGACYYNGQYYDPVSGSVRQYTEQFRFGVPDSVYWRYYLPGTQYAVRMLEMPGGDLLWLIHERQSNNIYRTLVNRVKVLGVNAPQILWTTEIPILDAELMRIQYEPTRNQVLVAGAFTLGEDVDPDKSFSGFASLNATTGALNWHQKTTEGGKYTVSNMGTDALGNMCVVGKMDTLHVGTSGGVDFWMACFDSTGVQNNLLTYQGVCGFGNDGAEFFAIRSDGKLLVNGSACESPSTSNWCTTLMYDSLLATVSVSPSVPRAFDVSLFPNPVSAYLQVYFPDVAELDIEVLDFTGKPVLTQFRQNVPATISVQHLPAGIYALRVKTLNSNTIRTTVIIKQ